MLSESQQRVAAYAVAAAIEDSGITVAPQDLPDAEQLRKRGWLDRKMDDDGDAVYSLTRLGFYALQLHDDLKPLDTEVLH
jgi:hypothetical protein